MVDPLPGLDFRPALPCEGETHSQGFSYHVPDQPGEFFAIAPCCGSRAVLCRSRVEYLTGPTVAEIRCQRCDLKHPPHTYRFEPLP